MPERSLSPGDRWVLRLASLYLALRHPFLMLRHRIKMGHWPDAGRPRSFSEKMLWRKLFDRNPLFVTATDKLAAKPYIAKRLPELPQPELLWTGPTADAIPDAIMAGPAMVKASNGSGANFRVEAGVPDRQTIARRTRHLLGPNGYRRKEEWAYWPIKGQLLAEAVLPLGGGDLPTDLKAYVAGGRTCVVWATDKLGGRSITLDADGTVLPGRDELYPDEADALPVTPRLVELTREAARTAVVLGAEFDMVRVDFLVTEAGLVAGELTIYSSAGYDIWYNPAITASIGKAWDLRQSWFLAQPRRGIARRYAEALIAAETLRHSPVSNKAS